MILDRVLRNFQLDSKLADFFGLFRTKGGTMHDENDERYSRGQLAYRWIARYFKRQRSQLGLITSRKDGGAPRDECSMFGSNLD
jgi:hypothetical protein